MKADFDVETFLTDFYYHMLFFYIVLDTGWKNSITSYFFNTFTCSKLGSLINSEWEERTTKYSS